MKMLFSPKDSSEVKLVKKKLSDVLRSPEVALVIDESRREAGIAGQHLVGPDGTIHLGVYGTVYVTGMTIEEARAAVGHRRFDDRSLRASCANAHGDRCGGFDRRVAAFELPGGDVDVHRCRSYVQE